YSKLDTVIVPAEAIKTSKERTYVNLLVDGTKIEQDVETGIEDGERTEILSGLSGGEEVIVG
ncbi:MAG: RND transporter, partial [Ruminococcus sp.]|nr:RND transporter [Ruminococcus sp.]